MAVKRKWYRCVDCGQLVYRRWRSDRPKTCLDCSTQRVIDNMVREMAARRARQEARNRQRLLVQGGNR